MPRTRYRCTWDDIACLDADHMAGWGAFDRGHSDTVDFDDDRHPVLAFEMAIDRDQFRVAYQWTDHRGDPQGEFIRSSISLERRPCRFGGKRVYFICPCCGGRVLRLAVLPEGLRCGTCGRVTWRSRREQPLARLIRKANKLGDRLGCEDWRSNPSKRPAHMRIETYVRLTAQRAAIVDEINRRIGWRLARKGWLATIRQLSR